MTTGSEQVHSEKGDTWPQILKYNYEKYGDSHRAMRYKHYGIWQPYTWEDYYLSVKHLALAQIGEPSHEKKAPIISRNRNTVVSTGTDAQNMLISKTRPKTPRRVLMASGGRTANMSRSHTTQSEREWLLLPWES